MLKIALWRTTRQLIIASLVVLVILLIIAHNINNVIFSPPRRALQEYHMLRLDNPAEYGLSIRSHACLDGKVPCLLVEPDALAGAAYRGQILRQQLAEKGIKLPAYGRVQGTVLLLHGRNGRKEDLLPVAERLVAAGFRTILVDLPAHGESPLAAMSFGQSDFERALPKRVLQDVRTHFGLPDEPAILWGTSMGGAFAVSAASEADSGFDGTVVLSSFAALEEVLEDQLPHYWKPLFSYLAPMLGVERWMSNLPTPRSIRPEKNAQKVTVPTLVVHGDSDYYVAPQQGRRVYSALSSDKKHWISVPYGGHRNVLATSMPVYAEITEWLLEALPTKP